MIGHPIALAIISFPTRPSSLHPHDFRDLVAALAEISRDVEAGRTPHTGTIIVPYQERGTMKVDMVLKHGSAQGKGQGQGQGRAPGGVPGPPGGGQGGGAGAKMWEFHMKYHALPVNYAMEIASLANSFASMVATTAGGAASNDPAYEVEFSYDAEEAMPKGIENSELAKLFKAEAQAVTLLYSQAVEMQSAGVELLRRLNESALVEIKAGQRK